MTLNGNPDNTNGYNSVIKNGEVADADLIKSIIPPIGTVMSWLKTFTNTPSLPDGWVECDGSVLSDTDSPYDGEVIPDLNNADRFLRGNSTSGGTGGATTSSHKHLTPFTTDNSIDGHIFRPDFNDWESNVNFSLADADMDVTGDRTDLNDTTTLGDEFFNWYTRDASTATIPPYYSVVWIMRVK